MATGGGHARGWALGVGPGRTPRGGRKDRRAKEAGVGRTGGGGDAAFRDLENYPLASQCPNLSRARAFRAAIALFSCLLKSNPAVRPVRTIWPVPSAVNASCVLCSTRRPCTWEHCRSLRRAASKPRRVSAGWHGRRERCAAESWSVLDEEEAGRHKSPSVEPAVRSPATALRSRAASLSTA